MTLPRVTTQQATLIFSYSDFTSLRDNLLTYSIQATKYTSPSRTTTANTATMLALLQQLLLFTLFAATEAAPTYTVSQDYGYHIGGGILGFIVLVLDIIVWSKS
jgi:hypothetical protein